MTVADLIAELKRLEAVAPRSKPAAKGALKKAADILLPFETMTVSDLVAHWDAPKPAKATRSSAALRADVVDRHVADLCAARDQGAYADAVAAVDALRGDKRARIVELRAVAHQVTGADLGKAKKDAYLQALVQHFRGRLRG